MSNQKFKLHPATILVHTIKNLKGLLFPALIVLFANGFSFSITGIKSILEILPLLILIGLFVWSIVSGVMKWWTFRYWMEENELKIEYGLFFKKKRYIPLERIQSINYKEGIVHRLFQLVQVSVETAGGATKNAEAELAAITKGAAEQIELMIQNGESSTVELIKEKTPIYKMSNRNLIMMATTSNGIGVVLAGIFAVISQIADYIPFKKIAKQFSYSFEINFASVSLFLLFALLIAWTVAVIITFIGYYEFSITKEDEQIEISRGLFEKNRITIPLQRIQAIKIVENPVRQLLGYATISIESASNGFTDKNDRKIILLPLIKKTEMDAIMKQIALHFQVCEEDMQYSPKRARTLFYRKYAYGLVLPVLISIYFWFPYGLLALPIYFDNDLCL